MSNQNDFVIDNGTGLAVRQDIEDALQALAGNSSGSSEPSVKYSYQWWADTNAAVMKLRNSANDGWIEIFQLDGTLTLEDGTVSAPALAARNDLNTGVFFSAADKFNIATGGVERLELGTETIFNEDGADVDFRIEGDTEANLFYVDAGNDRIGIATNAPDKSLTIGGTVPVIKMNDGSGRTVEFRCGSTSHNPGIVTTYVSELFLGCNSTESVKVGSEHLTIQNGDLIIGTAGHGISFINQADTASGETVSSSILDEYEEGSFDVNYKTGSAGSNTLSAASYASTGGLYTKIGDMVHFQIRIKCSSHTTVGGQIVIEGLPFTQVNSVSASGAYITASQMLSGSNNARLIISSNGTQIEFQNLDGTALQSGAGGLNFNNEFHCAGSYKAVS